METRDALDTAIAHDDEATTLRQTLRALRAQAATLRTELETVRARHRREEEDVERLDGLGLTALTSLFRRTRDDDVRREQAEEEAARADLKASLARLRAVEDRAEEADRRLAWLGDTATTREAAATAHAQALVDSGTPEGVELAELLAGIASADEEVAQLERQREAGSKAATSLDAALRQLGVAGDWSTVDTFGGGEAFVGTVKAQRMQAAGQWIVEAQDAFFDFAQAVRDPGPVTRLRPDLGVSDLRTTVDVWLDDPISDWMVHRSIQDSSEQVEAAAAFVRDALAHALQRQAAVEQHRAGLAARRDALLSPRA
ncbi:hypothetical protein [Oryzobacter telluris]|uniref:hypothetical protein n=1 Tax=Oryzobacter telluris TaxID=3149179 RepID=UPI00370D2024